MATTTPNFGWSVPTSTDLVKDGAVAIETLGDSIDASLVDLKGGTTGQVLAKASGTDMDFTWSAVGGADPYLVNKASGQYTRAKLANAGIGTNAAGVLAQTCYTPVYLPDCTVDRIAVRTQTWDVTANYTVRLGIYNNSNGKPSTVLLDAGTVSAIAANTTYEITISQAITAGWYWLAANMQTQVVSGTAEFLCTNSTTGKPQFFGSNLSQSFGSDNSGWLETGITGAFATASPTATNNELILTALRIA